MTIGALLNRLRTRGFVGPAYSGFVGKARFAFEEFVARREVVLVAEAGNFTDAAAPTAGIEVLPVDSWPELERFADEIDAGYHSGYVAKWRGPFDRGEKLFLALRNGRVAGFGWLQIGTPEGLPCHYALIKLGEFRILRVGVLPSFRRQGVNVAFYSLLLRELFSRGARRVYIDSSSNNIPSLRAQRRAGFRPLREIFVRGRLFGNGVIRVNALKKDN